MMMRLIPCPPNSDSQGDFQLHRGLILSLQRMEIRHGDSNFVAWDFSGASLRALAKKAKDGNRTPRLVALAEIYDGGSRSDAARIGGVGLQTIRDWVLRFNARGPDGLVDGKATGRRSKLSDDHRRALAAMVEAGPIPAIQGVGRWRLLHHATVIQIKGASYRLREHADPVPENI
jgi:transposase